MARHVPQDLKTDCTEVLVAVSAKPLHRSLRFARATKYISLSQTEACQPGCSTVASYKAARKRGKSSSGLSLKVNGGFMRTSILGGDAGDEKRITM